MKKRQKSGIIWLFQKNVVIDKKVHFFVERENNECKLLKANLKCSESLRICR